MMIVIEGTCKVYQKDKLGNNIFMRKLNKGDLFGLSAFLSGTPRRISVVSLTEVKILIITHDNFDTIIKHHPKVVRSLSEVLSKRIQENTQALSKINNNNPTGKNTLISSIMTKFISLVKNKQKNMN